MNQRYVNIKAIQPNALFESLPGTLAISQRSIRPAGAASFHQEWGKMVLEKIALALVLVFSFSSLNAVPLGPGFTYQGALQADGAPANGDYDFQFELFDAASLGAMTATPIIIENVVVTDGVFTTELDFGFGPFSGDQLWLEIGVRDGASVGGFTGLLPRQKLTTTPYAIQAEFVAAGSVGNLEINPAQVQQRVSGSCVAGSFITAVNQDGTVVCANDDTGFSSITGAEIVDGTVEAIDLAPASVGSGEIVASQVQRRVIGSCGTGSYLAGINEDGSVQCEILPFGQALDLDVFAVPLGGTYTSVAIRSNGLPIISYVSGVDLMAYDCSNQICSAGTEQTLDVGAYGKSDSSMAIGADGLAIVSYRGGNDLRAYKCSNSACSAGTISILDSSGNVGEYTSIAIRSNGLPIISHFDIANGDLKVFDCGDTDCTTGTPRTLESATATGEYTSIAIRSSGLPAISYFDQTEAALKFYDCSSSNCATGFSRTLDNSADVGRHTSMVINSSGRPIIAYEDLTNLALKLYACDQADCNSGAATTLDSASNVGKFTSVAIRANSKPIISYYDQSNASLKVFDCFNSSCSGGIARTLDSGIMLGQFTSLALRANDLPVITYNDGNGGRAKVFNCGDSRCAR